MERGRKGNGTQKESKGKRKWEGEGNGKEKWEVTKKSEK